jgi:hypothetical protein
MHYQERNPLATKMGRPPGSAVGAQVAVEKIRQIQSEFRLNDRTIASLAGVAQPSVGRALNRNPPIWTPSLSKLFAYAQMIEKGSNADARKFAAAQALSAAALEAWDGTENGLARLVQILDLLRNQLGTIRL